MPNGAYRVLVAVFNYTNAVGQNAHPGEARLAHDTGMSVRSVRDHLKCLTDNGYLVKGKRGHGSGGSQGMATVYSLGSSPTGDFAPTATGENAEATGDIWSTYRQDSVELPAGIRPLSDPLSDPESDHVHSQIQQARLLEYMRNFSPSVPIAN
jgi:hypothetical protein